MKLTQKQRTLKDWPIVANVAWCDWVGAWESENQTPKRQRTIPHFFVSGRERERERTKAMASSKLQALWNHPAGPKTSESTQIFNPFISIHFLIFYLCFVFAWFRCFVFLILLANHPFLLRLDPIQLFITQKSRLTFWWKLWFFIK